MTNAVLPKEIQRYIFDEWLGGKYADEIWNLVDKEKVHDIKSIVYHVYTKQKTVDEFIAETNALIDEPAVAKKVVINILGWDFLRIAKALGENVVLKLQALGANPANFVKDVPINDALAEFFDRYGESTDDEILHHRLEQAVAAKLFGEKSDIETVSLLTRSRKIGGGDMNESQARLLVDAMNETLSRYANAYIRVYRPVEEIAKEEVVVPIPKITSSPTFAPRASVGTAKRIPIEVDEAVHPEIESVMIEAKQNWPSVDVMPDLPAVKSTMKPFLRANEVSDVKEISSAFLSSSPTGGDPQLSIVNPPPTPLSELRGTQQPPPYRKGVSTAPIQAEQPRPSRQTVESVPVRNVQQTTNLMGKSRLMTDVISEPRLVGPVEELASITIVDFRKMSKDATVAAAKIKHKIVVLEDRGFEVMVNAKVSFEKSELFRVYLEILNTTFHGQKLDEVIKARIDNGTPTLNAGEFKALMQLSREVRFLAG